MSLFDRDYSHFTFTYRCNGKDVTINLDKQDATVTDLLDEFMNFMKACGYCFHVDDRLDVVNDFTNNEPDTPPASEIHETYPGFDTPAPTNEWVEYDANGKAQHFSSTPGFNYKLEDY